jgi:hypothetical protein
MKKSRSTVILKSGKTKSPSNPDKARLAQLKQQLKDAKLRLHSAKRAAREAKDAMKQVKLALKTAKKAGRPAKPAKVASHAGTESITKPANKKPIGRQRTAAAKSSSTVDKRVPRTAVKAASKQPASNAVAAAEVVERSANTSAM